MTRLRWALVAVLVLTLLVTLEPMTIDDAVADIDGDGVDEIGAFAVEVDGMARGPWYQIWDNTGSNVANKFLLSDHSGFQFKTIDLNNNGAQELVVLARRNSDNALRLEVRSSAGALVLGRYITNGPSFSDPELFAVNFDADAAVEIGVGLTRDSDGAGIFDIYTFTPGEISLSTRQVFTSGAVGDRDWDAADFDGDGQDEVFVGYRRLSDGAGGYSVFDPGSGDLLGNAVIGGPGFSNHQWIMGDFHVQTGAEVLIGFSRTSDGLAAFQIRNEAGTNLGGRFVTNTTFTGHEWRAISSGGLDFAFVGFQRASTGVPAFQVWNPVTATRVSSRFIIGTGFSIIEWLTGNFDPGTAGEEIGVGFVRDSDGLIGFQTWSRDSNTRIGSTFVLSGAFVSPSFLSLNPLTPTRDDILIGAANSSGAPVFKVHRPNGTLAFGRFIFNSDVI